MGALHPPRCEVLFGRTGAGEGCLDRSDVSCLYIGLTRESAKRIMWKDVLKAINRRHKLGIRFNESELSAKFPNGSVIYLVGADSNEDERQKLLGQKFVLVVIDEAQAFGIDLRKLVYGVLKPAVADYRGTIVLTGTPGNLIKVRATMPEATIDEDGDPRHGPENEIGPD